MMKRLADLISLSFWGFGGSLDSVLKIQTSISKPLSWNERLVSEKGARLQLDFI